jgi:hypothetical protein
MHKSHCLQFTPRKINKLKDFKYFKVKLFYVTSISLLVPDICMDARYLKNRSTIFQHIKQKLEFKYLEKSHSTHIKAVFFCFFFVFDIFLVFYIVVKTSGMNDELDSQIVLCHIYFSSGSRYMYGC